MTLRARPAAGEDILAGMRAVLGLTAGVGAFAAAGSAVIGDPLVVVAVPTAALAVLLAIGRSMSAAGYAATGVWLVFLPHAAGVALLVPLVMSLICLAIALGPDRLLGWVNDDFRGRRGGEAGRDRDEGWIEDG